MIFLNKKNLITRNKHGKGFYLTKGTNPKHWIIQSDHNTFKQIDFKYLKDALDFCHNFDQNKSN